jgi:hypothetical protein
MATNKEGSAMTEFETHHGWAVDVKDRSLYHDVDPDEVLGADRVQALYDMEAQAFWQDAELLAKERGFEGVWQEGRSGGYAVPHPQPDPADGLERVNVERKMLAFARELGEAMEYHRQAFREAVAVAIAVEMAEPAERAYNEARDIETV